MTVTNKIKYLKMLSQKYPTIEQACAEVIKLKAVLHLPKGTEHFISDLHGEYESFLHMLKNGSGVIRLKIDELFSDSLSEEERKTLATLIYYPKQKLAIIKKQEKDMGRWYEDTIACLIQVARLIVSKYTREKVSAALPKDYKFLVDELLYGDFDSPNKKRYYYEIIRSMIEMGQADTFIETLSNMIIRIAVDRLHIIGDIYDRGPGADIIMDALESHHSVDVQWGNHDVLWMGAAAGNEACIANVVRICTRYDNLHTLEDGYGISVRPLIALALDVYKSEISKNFVPIEPKDDVFNDADIDLLTKIHKAITIIQFKLEGQLVGRRPEYLMEERRLLHKINFEEKTVELKDGKYLLNDTDFPTIDPSDPYRLTEDEKNVVERLKAAFTHSEKLKRHVRFLFAKGSLYLKYNGNLLFHGCVPMDEKGEFSPFETSRGRMRGRALMDYCDKTARQAFFGIREDEETRQAVDFMWYLWCGPQSPLFGKDRMTTFERYFVDKRETHKEKKNYYYQFIDSKDHCEMILDEFGLDAETGHIINGHVPVGKEESPVKAGGKAIIIDGGLSRPYRARTGKAGCTLIFNSYEMRLVSHQPFESMNAAIESEQDILSTVTLLEKIKTRRYTAHTEEGKDMQLKIDDLSELIEAYRNGTIKERFEEEK